MNIYKGVSKHSWEEIVQLMWTIVTYLPKKMLNMELNMILMVLMQFTYIRHLFLNFRADFLKGT